MSISQKTLDDLEFDIVKAQVESYCITSQGKNQVKKLKPLSKEKEATDALNLVNEFLSSFENENRIPNHGFEDIIEELKTLRIENNFLEIEQFRKISSLSITCNILLKFFKKFKEYYPLIFDISEKIEKTDLISNEINIVDWGY